MKKKYLIIVGMVLGISALSFGFLNSGVVLSKGKYLDAEKVVQKSVIDTFNLDTSDLKPLFMNDVYDDSIATDPEEIRIKIAKSINILNQEMKKGDYKPMIFLKGSNTVLIGIKHPDGIISLTEFDISKDTPVKVNKLEKEAK